MNSNGTALPVATHSDLWSVEVIGMGETPRVRQGKVVPATGEITYASGCILRSARPDGARADKSASVHVLKPAAVYELGVVYRAQGRIYVMPYTPNGADRGTLSITVEELVPAESASVPAGRSKDTAAA